MQAGMPDADGEDISGLLGAPSSSRPTALYPRSTIPPPAALIRLLRWATSSWHNQKATIGFCWSPSNSNPCRKLPGEFQTVEDLLITAFVMRSAPHSAQENPTVADQLAPTFRIHPSGAVGGKWLLSSSVPIKRRPPTPVRGTNCPVT